MMVDFLSPKDLVDDLLFPCLSLLFLLFLGLLDLSLPLFLESDRPLLRLLLLLLRPCLLLLLLSPLSPSSPSRLSVSLPFLAGSLRFAAGRVFTTGELTLDFETDRDW